jgi:hypothetical protein
LVAILGLLVAVSRIPPTCGTAMGTPTAWDFTNALNLRPI